MVFPRCALFRGFTVCIYNWFIIIITGDWSQEGEEEEEEEEEEERGGGVSEEEEEEEDDEEEGDEDEVGCNFT